jgi:hypothetical protein
VDYPLHNSPYFDVREFVCPRTFKMLGVKSAWLIDPKIVRVCDLLRELVGAPVTVNNWHYAAPHENKYVASGFRAVWEKVGGQLSQHRRGCAADVKVKGMSPAALLSVIMAHGDRFDAAGLTTIESIDFTPNWLHLDTRPRLKGISPEAGFLIVKPV